MVAVIYVLVNQQWGARRKSFVWEAWDRCVGHAGAIAITQHSDREPKKRIRKEQTKFIARKFSKILKSQESSLPLTTSTLAPSDLAEDYHIGASSKSVLHMIQVSLDLSNDATQVSAFNGKTAYTLLPGADLAAFEQSTVGVPTTTKGPLQEKAPTERLFSLEFPKLLVRDTGYGEIRRSLGVRTRSGS
jgi:hypothetical protein